MTDIHTHILPGLDDGAESLYDTLEMAVMACESGTTVSYTHLTLPTIYSV